MELGSEFDSVSRSISLSASINYPELPGFFTPTTPGHSGVVRFCRGTNGDAELCDEIVLSEATTGTAPQITSLLNALIGLD